MTSIAGFLTRDFGPAGLQGRPLELDAQVRRETFGYNFPPWGAFFPVNAYPAREMSEDEVRLHTKAHSRWQAGHWVLETFEPGDLRRKIHFYIDWTL